MENVRKTTDWDLRDLDSGLGVVVSLTESLDCRRQGLAGIVFCRTVNA